MNLEQMTIEELDSRLAFLHELYREADYLGHIDNEIKSIYDEYHRRGKVAPA